MKTQIIVYFAMFFFITGCVSENTSSHTPISSSSCWWVQSDTLEAVWPYLKREKVQKFGLASKSNRVEPPHYELEITEPKRIKVIMDLIRKAVEEEIEREEKGEYGWRGGPTTISGMKQMIIITDKHKYAISIEDSGERIYGMEWESSKLRKQLWEWGLLDKGRVYNYTLPPKEQTVAILLYPKNSQLNYPIAIFGDKKLTKEYMFGIIKEGKVVFSKYDRELEPRMVFEGRKWLEKIIDAYEIALKEAKEERKYFPKDMYAFDARIVFITRDRFYWKGVGVDDNTIYDDYIKSEQLKAYFDELGLTKELLAGEPNEAGSDRLVFAPKARAGGCPRVGNEQ